MSNELLGVSPRLDLLTPLIIHTYKISSPISPLLYIFLSFYSFPYSPFTIFVYISYILFSFCTLIFVITQIYAISFILSFCITLNSFLLLIFYSDCMVAPNCLQDKSDIHSFQCSYKVPKRVVVL